MWAYLELLRPPNVVTAIADVLAGAGVAGAALSLGGGELPAGPLALCALLLATIGLYGGGVVLNDVFDAPLDAEERPKRPIPSGRASRTGAGLFGGLLLVGGVLAASVVSLTSAVIAVLVASGAVLYDGWTKDHPVFGPTVMGLCRGGNLLLGVSLLPGVVLQNLYLLLLPVAFIGAITAISQGEVHGGHRKTGVLALTLIAMVLIALTALGFRGDYRLLHASPFLLLFAIQVVPPFVQATRTPTADSIRSAVKAGVMAVIPLDATLAAGFGGAVYGIAVLSLLLVSLGLSRLFDVT